MTLLEQWTNQIICGDCLELMKQLPDGCVHCCVTSIPYYGLRDYGLPPTKWPAVDYSPIPGFTLHIPEMECCYGLEPTPEAYTGHGVLVFRETWRILHPTGTLWLNMGDSYAGSGEGGGGNRKGNEYGQHDAMKGKRPQISSGLKPKDLLEMPSDVVKALRADGWWLRSRIPWLKRNAMPESVQGSRWERHRVSQCPECKSFSSFKKRVCKICGWRKPANRGETEEQRKVTGQQEHDDNGGFKSDSFMVDCPGCPKCDPNDGLVLRMSAGRPTQAVEYVFLLQKSPDCFYDGEAVRVLNTDTYFGKRGACLHRNKMQSAMRTLADKKKMKEYATSGRSRRNSDWFFESWQGLWTDENGEPLAFIVNPMPYKQAHFATFPPGLVIPCLKAGTSEKGCCPECGNPWVRIIDKEKSFESGSGKSGKPISGKNPDGCQGGGDTGDVRKGPVLQTRTLGWRPTCSCGKGNRG